MRKLSVLAALALTGCAAIMNSDRPGYAGPILKTAWRVSEILVETTPVIHDGIVYVRARPWAEDKKRLYAFELKTGRQLWVSDFKPERILFFVGPLLFVLGEEQSGYSIDAKTGKQLSPPARTNIANAESADGMLYANFRDQTVTAMDSPSHIVWSTPVPTNVVQKPVVTANAVFVAGRSQTDKGVDLGSGIAAYHRKTGAPLWKWETKDYPISDLTADSTAAYVSVQQGNTATVIAFEAITGKQLWTHATERYFDEGPRLLADGTVLVRDNPPGQKSRTSQAGYVFRGLNRATGATTWESKTNWKFPNWIADDHLMFSADNKVHALLNEGGATSPDSWLGIIDIRTGKELARSEVVELGIFTSPVAAEGFVVVGSVPHGWQKAEAAGLFAWAVPKQ